MPKPGPLGVAVGPTRDAGTQSRESVVPSVVRRCWETDRLGVVIDLRGRIEAAETVEQLIELSRLVAAVRTTFRKEGAIERGGRRDADLRSAVLDRLTERMGVVQQMVVDGLWAAADTGDVEEAGGEVIVSACWEVIKTIIEARFGAFAEKAADAIRDRSVDAFVEAGVAAFEGIAESFSDRDGVMREVLKRLKKAGIGIDGRMESRLRKRLATFFGNTLAGTMEVLGVILKSPVVVFLRLSLVSDDVAGDAVELGHALDFVEARLARRLLEMAPVRPPGPLDLLPKFDTRPQLRQGH